VIKHVKVETEKKKCKGMFILSFYKIKLILVLEKLILRCSLVGEMEKSQSKV